MKVKEFREWLKQFPDDATIFLLHAYPAEVGEINAYHVQFTENNQNIL